MSVDFYEQVPERNWDIPLGKRLKYLIFKLRWSEKDFVSYIYSTIIGKVECDIWGWNNYRGFRVPTWCPDCNEIDAEMELFPVYLLLIKNLNLTYKSKFRDFEKLVDKAIYKVCSSMKRAFDGDHYSDSRMDDVIKRSKFSTYSLYKE